MSQPAFVLEVIVCTVEDAIEAEKGGAGRLEVISHFECGGLTPSLELVRAIQSTVRLPLRVMLRESDGYQVAGSDEIARLCSAARELAALRVDGVVLGFLRDGKVDIDLTNRILDSAPTLKATFHRAFDETGDPFEALAKLGQYRQIDRILTSGGPGDWSEKAEMLARYQDVTGGHPIILVGGGVDASVIKAVRATTNLAEFHIGRAARAPAAFNGSVQSARVRELMACITNPGDKRVIRM
jgi:copper homeostasis protein